jgi:hypothetical protein
VDEEVRRWRQKGKIHFWFEKDKRQGAGWHLAADEVGCQDLDDIISLCRTAGFPPRFNITPSARPDAPANTNSTLVISYNTTWPEQHWLLGQSGTLITLEIGTARLDELSAAVGDMRRGEGDYAIGGDDDAQVIWIWWLPK